MILKETVNKDQAGGTSVCWDLEDSQIECRVNMGGFLQGKVPEHL